MMALLANHLFLRANSASKQVWQLSRMISKTSLNHISACGTTYQRVQIKDVIQIQDKDMLRVKWNDQMVNDFPLVFLRDNCLCSSCFHPTFKQKLLDIAKLDNMNIEAKKLKYDADADTLIITWSNEHESVFHSSWLRERKFPSSWSNVTPSTLYGLCSQPWSSSTMKGNLPVITYEKLMSNDQYLLSHLENLIIHGLSIIQGAPIESGVLRKLASRMSHEDLKKTNYGEIFSVKSKPSPTNLAYTSRSLRLHVDLPFYSYQPEIQMMHCIEQSCEEDAGVSMLTDGFHAAEELRETNPKYYELLTKAKFKFHNIGTDVNGEFNLQAEKPVIGLDNFGNVDCITYANHSRSSFINAPVDKIVDCYKANYALFEILYRNVIQYKMQPGDIMLLNNKRVLHGRSSFDASASSRWLEGGYLDWDGVHSKYRVTRDVITK